MSKSKFPNRFLSWSGSRDLAVKRPFALNNEVPTEKFIETNLTKRLNKWADDILKSNQCPNIIFLVGGPGNGKSAALEYGIEKICIDKSDLRDHLRESFSKSKLPRKVEYDIAIGNYEGISIVQDATIPQGSNIDAEEALINDIKDYVFGNDKRIYVCCINRGILAQAISKAYKLHENDDELKHFLEKVMECLQLSSDPIDTWPLDNFPNVGVWPMDIESLVDANIYQNGLTPFHQILEIATSKDEWENEGQCNAGKYCPFEMNRRLLSEVENVNSLVKILRYFELKSGKKWNFRELFALAGHLFIGSEKSFHSADYRLSPCEWAEKKANVLESNSLKPEKIDANYQLCSKLYYHNLFPRWPNFDELIHEYQNKIEHRLDSTDSQLFLGFHSILSSIKEIEVNSDINRIIISELNPILDPGMAQSQESIKDTNVNINEIEYEYSHSVNLGNEKINQFEISHLEKSLLDYLEDIEGAISNAREVAKNYSRILDQYDNALKTFTCRFIKRNIGCRFKLVKDYELTSSYDKILTDGRKFAELSRVFKGLLMNNSNNLFEASLVTTFAQPELRRERDVFLQYTGLKISTKSIKASQENRPKSSRQFFIVENQPVALTYELYSALVEVENGLEPTSLNYEVYALLDSIRSKALGSIINDKEKFSDLKVKLGLTGEEIDYYQAIGFSVREENYG